jgi:hypothetical protein
MTTHLPTYLHERIHSYPAVHLKSSAITVLIVCTHTYIIVVTNVSSSIQAWPKKKRKGWGQQSGHKPALHPNPRSHKTQFRPVPKNAECCARDMPRPLIYPGMHTLTNTLLGLTGRRNGQLDCPVCKRLLAIRPQEGADANKRPILHGSDYMHAMHAAIGVLFTKVQGSSSLVVCDIDFTGLEQRLWVRGDSMRCLS